MTPAKPDFLRTATEAQLRDCEAPWPKTKDELDAVLTALGDRDRDYGTCVYAISIAATAAFRYMASHVGATGFQASCADLDVLRRTRRMEGNFIMFPAADLLYPQYDFPKKPQTWMAEQREWLAKEAKELLRQPPNAHPDVIAHWQKLAEERSE